MAALAFPSSPSVNDTFTSGSRSWKWTGSRWAVIPSKIPPSRLSGAGAVIGDVLSFDGDEYSPVPLTPDAQLLNRANHTGTQAIATVSGLQAALDGKQPVGSYVVKNTTDATPVNAIRCMTQGEYDALGTYDPNTLYFIK